MTLIGWNWRSLSKNKILYTNYLLETYKPDYIIIWETWLNNKPTQLDQNYEIYQTPFSKFQGVCIIAKKNTVNKIYINDKQYIIAIESRNKEHSHFVIGAYFKQNMKKEILVQLIKLIKRINRAYIHLEIILFWDLNPDTNFPPEQIEKILSIKTWNQNKLITTRQQERLGNKIESTLDYFFSTQQIVNLERLDKFESDHYPIKIEWNTSGKMKKQKKSLTLNKLNINKDNIKAITDNEDWPSKIDINPIKSALYNKLTIRPTIKLQTIANEIFNQNIEWETKQIQIKDAWRDSFKNYVLNLDLQRTQDTSKFYNIINSLIKYKRKGKIVKGIKQNQEIIIGNEKKEKIINYFKQLYKGPINNFTIENKGIFDYRINVTRGIEKWAINKATGIDWIPGEFYKDTSNKEIITKKLQEHFENYLRNMEVPDYFMKAKLCLISKDGTEYPEIDNIRPISVLPTITKIFELSILNHLEEATASQIFSNSQRGFLKGKSTLNNIKDVLQMFNELQKERKANKRFNPMLIFYDFKKAYDSVSRHILIRKLQNFQIPTNIISIIGNMLKKSTLIFEGKEIKTFKGLIQGSTLSPLLFNLYLNDLLVLFNMQGIFSRAYADDVICICSTLDQVNTAMTIMKEWSQRNKMRINKDKSGIMRILLRKGKWKGINNILKIPEVESYCYLGIRIDQSLKMKDHLERLNTAEKEMRKKIGILKPSLLNTKSRLIVFNTILKAKFWYAAAIICHFIPGYTNKLEAIIYRSLKQLFWIRTNVSKKLLFKLLNIEDTTTYIKRVMNKLNGVPEIEKERQKSIIEHLSLQAIKLKLNCLFTCRNKTPLCACGTYIKTTNMLLKIERKHRNGE